MQLKELFLRNGIPLNNYGENDPSINATAPETWPVWHAGVDGSNNLTGARADVEFDGPTGTEFDTHFLNQYFHLNLGQGHDDGNPARPWFMPTFNMVPENQTTAAAGRALDGEIAGATHPGEGTANFWSSGDVAYALRNDDDELILETDEEEQHSTRQVLEQERAPISMAAWQALPENQRVGKYWVVEPETGWAYWADLLMGATPGNADGGEATSFFIDSKAPQAALGDIRVDWTYKLNVFGEWEPATEQGVVNFTEDRDIHTAGERVLVEMIWNYHNNNN
ncbi:hypothetical protein [Lactococcus petauri]|uniref:hypothetical protein n=1 Tax=Lactococcus petauri TaxID=1940789 RepID=UPI001E3A1C42|nr:hypothetical protein [Lactococcus petauri]